MQESEKYDKLDDDCYACQCKCAEDIGQDYGNVCKIRRGNNLRCYEKCEIKDILRCKPHCKDHDGTIREIGYMRKSVENCEIDICKGHMNWVPEQLECPWGGVKSVADLGQCDDSHDHEHYEIDFNYLLWGVCECHWRFCIPGDCKDPCPDLDIQCPYDQQPVIYYDNNPPRECDCPKVRCECIEVQQCTDYDPTKVCEARKDHRAVLVVTQEINQELGVCNQLCECQYIPLCLDLPCTQCELDYGFECWRAYQNPYLDNCRVVVDPYVYLMQCYFDLREICYNQITDETSVDTVYDSAWYSLYAYKAGCSSVDKFAQQCSCDSGVCRNDWRHAYLVPFFGYWGLVDYRSCETGQCDASKEFQTCGPNYVKTCENRDWYDFYYMFGFIQNNKQGCFCPEGKVLKGNVCVFEWECPICTDCNGTPRSVGEWWPSCDGTCSKMTCDCRTGHAGQVLTKDITCPEVLTTCDAGQILRSGMSDDGCCEHTWCEGATCGSYIAEHCSSGVIGEECGFGETPEFVYAEEDSSKCCPIRKCLCSEATCSPLDHEQPPSCRPWERVQTDSQAMCTCRKCVCEPEQCEVTLEMYQAEHCIAGKEKAIMLDGFDPSVVGRENTLESQCCPQFTCVCNPAYCREGKKCNGQDFVDCIVNWITYDLVQEDINGEYQECCAVFDEVCTCEPQYCAPAPMCAGPCQALIETEAPCCNKFECICDPSQCPVDDQTETTCGKGYMWTTTDEVLVAAPCECCQPIYKKMCIGCYPEFCPAPVELDCPIRHINVLEKQDCCDCFTCECEPTKKDCPKSEPTPCPAGMTATEHREILCCDPHTTCVCDEPKACGACPACTKLVETAHKHCPEQTTCECVPLDFCQWEGKAHFPGTTWMPQGDKCTTCFCPSEPNADGLFAPVCNTECCGDCPMGHSRVPDAESCCGGCIPLSCVDNENKKRSVGDSWKAVEDECVTCTCKQGKRDIYAECFSTRRVLTEECPEEFIYRSEDGCVVECQRPQSVGGCSVTTDYTGRLTVTNDGQLCESTQDFTINMCSGECVSTTTNVDGKMQRQCSCCSVSKSIEREIDVKCADGSVRKHVVELVEECQCGATKCDSEEPKSEAQKEERRGGRRGGRKGGKKGKKSTWGKLKGALGF